MCYLLPLVIFRSKISMYWLTLIKWLWYGETTACHLKSEYSLLVYVWATSREKEEMLGVIQWMWISNYCKQLASISYIDVDKELHHMQGVVPGKCMQELCVWGSKVRELLYSESSIAHFSFMPLHAWYKLHTWYNRYIRCLTLQWNCPIELV